MFEYLIESHDMNDILLHLEEIGDQLLNPMNLHLFTHEWKVIVQVMKVAMIEYVHLQEVALLMSALSQLTDVSL